MKKIFLSFFVVLFLVMLSGCGSQPNSTVEKNLEQLKNDANYKDNIYHRVCFGVYKKGTGFFEGKLEYVREDCYYIHSADFGDSDPLDKSLYEQDVKMKGYMAKDLTKELNIYGYDVFKASIENYKPILPVCNVNDSEEDKYCISSYWLTKVDIILNDIVILNA